LTIINWTRRLDYLERRVKRIQELCKEWKDKLESDPSVDAKSFVTSVNTIVFSINKFKTRVKLISSMGDVKKLAADSAPQKTQLKDQKMLQASSAAQQSSSSGGNSQPVQNKKAESKGCVVM
jgi:hypothetical protein